MIETTQGIPSVDTVPFAPDMAKRILSAIEWDGARMRHQYGNGPDPGVRPDTTAPSKCEVCGDKHFAKGWCRKHHRIAKDNRDPFLEPEPTQGRIGRPRAAHTSDRNYMIRVSSDVMVELDKRLAGSSDSRTKAIDAVLREFLGMQQPQKKNVTVSASESL